MPGEHEVRYAIYDIVGQKVDDSFIPVWLADDDRQTDKMDDAQVFLSGNVRWDGCSNWYFNAQNECMIHACNRKEVERIGEVMALCWDWTAELCEKWQPC